MRNSAPRLARGFTLVELAIVLILIAVLAAYIAPRLQTSEFDELGFFVDTLSAIRYAHKVALTSACDVLVTVTPGAGGGVALTYTGVGGCAAGAVFNPADATPFTTTAPANVAIAGPSFTYDLIGGH